MALSEKSNFILCEIKSSLFHDSSHRRGYVTALRSICDAYQLFGIKVKYQNNIAMCLISRRRVVRCRSSLSVGLVRLMWLTVAGLPTKSPTSRGRLPNFEAISRSPPHTKITCISVVLTNKILINQCVISK